MLGNENCQGGITVYEVRLSPMNSCFTMHSYISPIRWTMQCINISYGILWSIIFS